jgi:hypothetical protein
MVRNGSAAEARLAAAVQDHPGAAVVTLRHLGLAAMSLGAAGTRRRGRAGEALRNCRGTWSDFAIVSEGWKDATSTPASAARRRPISNAPGSTSTP